jgi:hypothetical protein
MAPVPRVVANLGTPGPVPTVPLLVPRPVPVPFPAVPVPPVAVPVPPMAVVVGVAAGRSGQGDPPRGSSSGSAGRGLWGLGAIGGRTRGSWRGLGPVQRFQGRVRRGRSWRGRLRPRAVGRLPVREGRWPVADGAPDHHPVLPRRAPLHGHDHLATAGLRRCPAGRPPARRRAPLRSARPAARRPDPPWFRRLDLDDLGGPQIGDWRVEPVRHRAAERFHQQLAGRHHRRQRRARRRGHAQGDDQRGVAATTREAVPWSRDRRVMTARSIGRLIVTLERFEPVGRQLTSRRPGPSERP